MQQMTTALPVVLPVDGVSECTVNGVGVERVEPRILDGIDQSDYSWCNTSNHRDTETYATLQKDGDCGWYQQIMAETRMEKWESVLGDLMRRPERVLSITASQQCKYFKPAAQLAKQGVRAKSLLRDEAEELAGELEESYEAPREPPSQGWFVRTSACSPKDAQDDGGAGPHHSLADVMLALFASERVHVSMKGYETDARVYLIPFDPTVTIERELRVFVRDNKVTAMSQYDVYNPSVFSSMDDAQLANVARCVDAFHREKVVPLWAGIDSYIMDVEFIAGKNDVRLIELNSFGAEMAAASCLFHWVRDADELYSSKRICIRVRAAEEEEPPSCSRYHKKSPHIFRSRIGALQNGTL